jgi:hypothetical protein
LATNSVLSSWAAVVLSSFASCAALAQSPAEKQFSMVNSACPEPDQLPDASRENSCLALTKSGKLNTAFQGSALGRIGMTYFKMAINKGSTPLDASTLRTAIHYLELATGKNRSFATHLGHARETLALLADIPERDQTTQLRLALSAYTLALAPYAPGFPEDRNAYKLRAGLYAKLCKPVESDYDFNKALQITQELNSDGHLDGELRELNVERADAQNSCDGKFRGNF